jgi:hypothetical protein
MLERADVIDAEMVLLRGGLIIRNFYIRRREVALAAANTG